MMKEIATDANPTPAGRQKIMFYFFFPYRGISMLQFYGDITGNIHSWHRVPFNSGQTLDRAWTGPFLMYWPTINSM